MSTLSTGEVGGGNEVLSLMVSFNYDMFYLVIDSQSFFIVSFSLVILVQFDWCFILLYFDFSLRPSTLLSSKKGQEEIVQNRFEVNLI